MGYSVLVFQPTHGKVFGKGMHKREGGMTSVQPKPADTAQSISEISRRKTAHTSHLWRTK